MANASSHLLSTTGSLSRNTSAVSLSSSQPRMEREQYLYCLVQVPNEDACVALVPSEPRGWIYLTSSRCLCCVETYICTSRCVICQCRELDSFSTASPGLSHTPLGWEGWHSGSTSFWSLAQPQMDIILWSSVQLYTKQKAQAGLCSPEFQYSASRLVAAETFSPESLFPFHPFSPGVGSSCAHASFALRCNQGLLIL